MIKLKKITPGRQKHSKDLRVFFKQKLQYYDAFLMQGGYQDTPLFCVLCSTDHVLSWIVQALSWGTHNAMEVKKKKLKERNGVKNP